MCVHVSECAVCGGAGFVGVPAGCPCVHQFVYVEDLSCMCERERKRDRGLAVESNNAMVCDRMILTISCSVGSWRASIAHNNNMFHMNPTPHHCQHLATNAKPAAHICNIL